MIDDPQPSPAYDSSLRPIESQALPGPALQFKLTRDAIAHLFPPGSPVFIALQSQAYERVADHFIKRAQQRFHPNDRFAQFMAEVRANIKKDLNSRADFPEPAKHIIKEHVDDYIKSYFGQANATIAAQFKAQADAEITRIKSEIKDYIDELAHTSFTKVLLNTLGSLQSLPRPSSPPSLPSEPQP